ncbi:MAG TPA: hypothetical protein VJ957_07910 [Longimicrobiales bacterium]|nr:hypothetical protein [Longimicrobiales bacterium]
MRQGWKRVVPPLMLVVLAACSQAMTVETKPDRTYAIAVENPTAQAMVVSYDDGTGSRLLGTVAAGDTERFVLAGARSAQITVSAVSEDRSISIQKSVMLRQGSVVHVALR